MKRRLFSLFLALTLVVGMLPAPAFAQETEPTQVTEAPTEAPATEAPATEAPATEPTPAPTEALAPETTVAPAPTEAPTEAPATEAPATEAPAAEPTPAPTEAPVPETTVAPAPTEAPTEPAPTEDEAVAAVQAMIDALPDVSHMSESYLDALEAAYSAFDALSESQQAQITGVEKLEALFNWVNSQVSTLADDVWEISGEENWNNQTFNTPVKLIDDTTLTLVGDNKIECDAPLDLNNCKLTVKGTGTLTVIGNGRSENWMLNGAIFDSTYNGYNKGGTLTLAGGTVKASGGKYNAISVRSVELRGGKLEAYGGSNAGIVCSDLYTYSGSLYATGSDCGIEMRTRNAGNPGNLAILASNEKNASMAEMDAGDIGDIQDNAKKKTYYIGEVSGPLLSVKTQQGYLYEGVADQKATFAISAKNVDMGTLKTQWVGDHTGLTESRSTDGMTLTVTTDATVKKGTYNLTVTVTGTDGTPVSKTVTVTVLGAPITVTTQPQDTYGRTLDGETWQGDNLDTEVRGTLADGLTAPITYQWKLKGGSELEDDTELVGFNQPTIKLADLYTAKKLTPVANKSWLSSARVYCTLTVGTYSVNTETVTMTASTCDYQRVDHVDGSCLQCGEIHRQEPLLVSEEGTYHAVDTSESGTAEVGGFLTKGGIFYLTKDVLTRDINAGNNKAGSADVTLDLQEHTMKSLQMGNFPYGSFTLKNGTLGVIDTVAGGKLILENIRYKETFISAQFDLTVQGENTRFEGPVVFHGNTHLKGGHFEQGLDSNCVERALELLEDGFAFYDNDNEVVDATDSTRLVGREIHVAAHTCRYSDGKCACGRTCDHVGKVNADGYCTLCKSLVVPYAIGEVRYTSLEDALTAANAGDTIILRGDFYQGSKTVEINKNVTLDLGGHTLTGDADGEPVLRVLAENVTIQNGTVENTRTAKSSPAVAVGKLDACAGLTVNNVTFIGSSDGNAPQQYALNIQNGHAKVESGTFNGGIYVEGNLTMTGGSTTRLELGSSQGKAELSGGTFDSINPGNAGYAALLAEGYAYQSSDGKLLKLADVSSMNANQVVKCTHPDGLTADTACPYCGKKCGHGNIDQTTGLCPECGYQKAVSLTVDGTTTCYDTFPEAVTAANGKTGALLTLLKDVVKDNDDQLTFESGEITVNWNGHTLSSNSRSSVIALNGAELTLRDSSGKNAGGIANQKTGAIYVSGGSLTIESGTYASRVFISVNTASVKISDGAFKNDPSSSYPYAIDTGGSRYLAELMAPGYTLALDPEGEKLIDMYTSKHTPEHTNVYVVPHASHNFDKNGKCACGAAASAQVEAGTESIYYGDFESAVNKAMTLSGSTVRLLKDVTHSGDSNIYINSGTFTIDWNGYTLSGSPRNNLMVITDSANVTLKDGSNTNAGGARQTGLGGAMHIAVGSEGSVKIQGGTYSPNVTRAQRCYGSVQISGGVFANPQGHGMNCALFDLSGNHLSGMLADNTAFAYEADGSDLLNAYIVNKSENYKTVYAVAHTHENFDEDGVCDCGYSCPHDQVDEEGVCTDCGKQFYVQGTYKDGTTHYYGALSDALGDPDVTQAVIICSFGPVCESWDGGDRSVTLDLNGIAVVVKSIQGGHLILCDSSGSDSILGMAEIQKDGQVTLESGSIYPQAETLSVYGKLTVIGGYVDSLTAMEGSTVSLSGGSFEKIVGSGVTLRSLLAEDRYYAELDGEAPKNYADTDTVIEGVSVKLCNHTSVRENKGTYFSTYTCNCGQVTYRLTVTVGENNPEYFGEYNDGFAYAAQKGGVVRFLTNGVNGTIEVNAQGTVTIDMEHRSYRADDRSLVIKSGSTVRLVGQGSVMSTPEPGSGGSGSGKLEYSEFIPVTVEAGGTFVLPANNLDGKPNMAKPTQLTVRSGGTAELQGGSTQWTDVYGTLKISGGSHSDIHQYEKGQLNITDGQITRLEIHGDIPQNALSGGSYVTISVWEFQFGESEKLRDVTFADFQKMLVSGKVFQKKQDQSYPNEVEETPNYGTFNYKKELNKVNVTAAPFTGVQVVCQLGTDTYEEKVSTQYNVGEMDSSGNVVFRLGVRTQPQEVQSGVTVQWYQLGAEDSRTLVGTGQTCPLDTKLPVGTHRFLAVVNCSGYVLESQPFAVTITPRVVNITGGFTAQDRDYEPDNCSVRIIQGEVTFDKKAEGDDLGAQVRGGTVATPDAGQNRTVTYSATLTGEDKDNYILGSVPDLTVTIRPIAQTLAFAEAAVTKTYGDSPFVNALDHSAGDGQITYTSSDPAVATVGTDGTVTILKTGTAKITATARATQNYAETSASFDLTVDKAAGTVKNKSYGLTYYYGYNLLPQASDFTADSTGEIHFAWTQDGKTVEPRDAGTYTLTVTVDGDENYKPASLVLTVTIGKSSNIGKAVDSVQGETVFGKNDGLVKLRAPAENCEYRVKGETEYRNIPGDPQGRTLSLAVGTYEFRLKETKNYNPTPAETVTIGAGPKLTVTLPSPQTGYRLRADKQELGWHDTLKLTLTLETGYYRTASLAVKAGDRVLTEDKGTYTLTDVEEDLTITLEGVEKDEKAPSLALQNWIFGQGAFQGTASRKNWENISTATAPYYVISNRGNYFAVEAWDGETGLASASYLLSRTALTREALEQAAWEPVPEESLNQAGPDREHMIQLGLGEWYFYVKAVDKAGNVSYVGSDKLIREENAPTFSGVTNGATYYTTQKVTITDDYALSRYLPPLSRYWKDISGTSYEVTLEGNREGTYTVKVEDACQNTATLTVTMKPISALTEDIRDLTEDNVQMADDAKLTQAEKALKALDTTNATAEEKKEIAEALDNIGKLKTVLEEVTQLEAMIAALPERVEPWDAETEKRVLDTRSAYDAMTDHQKTMVDDSKLRALEGQLVDYQFTSGENQTWALGSGKDLRFTVNGQLAKVKEVRLNGQTVDTEKTAQAKGTDFALKAADLQGLKLGSYTLQVYFTDGQTPQTQFTVTVSPNYLDLSGYPEFGNDETVTVNGRIYPIGTDSGRYINLPETGDILQRFTYLSGGYSAAHENYPTGMAAYRIIRQEGGAKLEPIEGLDNLLIYSGCSIRLTGKQGIRMITGITQDNKKALTGKAGLAGYTLEEYGTLICWNTDLTSGDDFSLDMSCARHNYAYLKGKADPVFARQDGKMLYTNVLVGFGLEDCAKDLILRPYIKLKDMTTGEIVTLYGGSVCRSIGYIAKQNENTYKPGTAGYKYIHEILNYTQTAEQGGKTK